MNDGAAAPGAATLQKEAERHGLGKLPDTLVAVLLLFPGFLTERVAAYLSSAPAVGDLQLVAAALAGTIFNVVVGLGVVVCIRKRRPRALADIVTHWTFLAIVLAISILSGIAWAYIDSHNVLFRFHVTDRASRAEPWETAFRANAEKERPDFVRVITKSLGVYHGQPLYYPQTGSDKSIVVDIAQREVASAGEDKAVGSSMAREPFQCVPVGIGAHGRVVIASDQVLAVEFRPKTQVDGDCAYRCAIDAKSKECPDGKSK